MTHIYYCILWGICLILAGCIRDDAAYGEAGIVAGDTLPEFQVELDNGSMLATSDLQGKVSAHGLTLPYSAQESRSVYNLFSGQGIPRVYVSDKSLQVYSTYSDDPIAGLDELTEDVEALRMKNKE